jgi:hypothetical protein
MVFGRPHRIHSLMTEMANEIYSLPNPRFWVPPKILCHKCLSVLSSPSAFPYDNSMLTPSCTPLPLTGTMPPHPPKPPFASSTPAVHQTATLLLTWIFRQRHLHSLKESNPDSDLTICVYGLWQLWTAKQSLLYWIFTQVSSAITTNWPFCM